MNVEVVALPTGPNATYAISAKFAKELSTSMHFANSPAVYLVTTADARSIMNPSTQPAYRKARGKLRIPTPMSVLELLNSVCGSVDCPTITSASVPSSRWPLTTSNGS